MAGTLFGLGLSQQVSATGTPLSGALLYIYQENSSTPVTTYSDFTLATEQTFPIVADSAGRLPQIWVADGSYRARLTTSAGVEVFDEASVTAIGASSASSSGSGGSTADSTTIFNTGDPIWVPVSGTRTGWVRANGRTIGSGSSGATERANGDTQALYEYLWNNFADSLCAVSGGRGASAVADFNANKGIATYDMRGYGPFGLDDMGNTAAGRIAANTPTVAGSVGGAETATLVQANVPSYSLSVTSLTGSVNTSITNGTSVVRNLGDDDFGTFTAAAGGGGGSDVFDDTGGVDQSTLSLASGTVTFGGFVPSGGADAAFNKMPPYRLGSWYLKL
jgi:microcystin-dependent protein